MILFLSARGRQDVIRGVRHNLHRSGSHYLRKKE